MASTSLVIDREDGLALKEERLVARLIEAVPASKDAAKAAEAERSFPQLASAVLSHTDDLLAHDDEMGERRQGGTSFPASSCLVLRRESTHSPGIIGQSLAVATVVSHDLMVPAA